MKPRDDGLLSRITTGFFLASTAAFIPFAIAAALVAIAPGSGAPETRTRYLAGLFLVGGGLLSMLAGIVGGVVAGTRTYPKWFDTYAGRRAMVIYARCMALLAVGAVVVIGIVDYFNF